MDGQVGAEAVNQQERRGSKRVHKHKAMRKSDCQSLTTRINEYKKACFGLVCCGGFRCFLVLLGGGGGNYNVGYALRQTREAAPKRYFSLPPRLIMGL